jgi:hypothetical protein
MKMGISRFVVSGEVSPSVTNSNYPLNTSFLPAHPATWVLAA